MNPVIIDLGSDTIRAGLSSSTDEQGNPIPSVLLRSIGGVPRPTVVSETMADRFPLTKDIYFGEEVPNLFDKFINRFTVFDTTGKLRFQYYEQLMHHLLIDKLDLSAIETDTLLSLPAWTNRSDVEKIVSAMFETNMSSSINIQIDALLSLYGHGMTSGAVVDTGYNTSRTVPVYEGYTIDNAISILPFGARNQHSLLSRILTEHDNTKGCDFDSGSGTEWLRIATVEASKCSPEESLSEENEPPLSMTLPDGELVHFGIEDRHALGDCFFDPSSLGLECLGVHQNAFQSIMMTDIDMRREFMRSIVLNGSIALTNGYSQRFKREMRQLSPSSQELRTYVHAPKNLQSNNTYIGGSFVSGLTTLANQWITVEDYDELGPTVVARKIPNIV